MADFKYIMQGFQKDINFFDEIKEVLETEDYTSIWILTAFVNERAICNLMPSIKKSKADISFIIGIRNNVSTYQALKCLINMKVSVFVFDTARIESIFHAKVIVGSGTNSATYIKKLQEQNSECTGAFCGYGVAVKDFRNLIIEFDRNNTYIQSEGINQDFGVYDCPDELLKEHHQEISAFKAFAYRHIGRHLMNRNVRKIRER